MWRNVVCWAKQMDTVLKEQWEGPREWLVKETARRDKRNEEEEWEIMKRKTESFTVEFQRSYTLFSNANSVSWNIIMKGFWHVFLLHAPRTLVLQEKSYSLGTRFMSRLGYQPHPLRFLGFSTRIQIDYHKKRHEILTY